MRFCSRMTDENLNVDELDWVIIGLRIGKLLNLKIKHFLSKGEIKILCL